MDSQTLRALDRRHIWHPYTQALTAPECLPIRSASGAVLVDENGREIIDLMSSWWVTLHGHAHPHIAEAVATQAQTLEQVIFAGFTHEPAVTLAQRLTDLLPVPLTRVFYSDNGSTAVEVAMKMALQFHRNQGDTKRTRFIAFEGGYHGDTVGAMSAGVSSKFFEAWRDMLFPVDILPVPATWAGDPDAETKEAEALAALDLYLDAHGSEVIAAVIEPLIQGAGGMRMHHGSFLRGLHQRLREYGALLAFDEVMTGFGRSGELFACLEVGVEPDFICLSKGLTGGFLPMAATITTEAVHAAFLSEKIENAFLHGHSFTANPLGCAAALASLDLLLDPTCAKRRKEIESLHWQAMRSIAEEFPAAKHPRVQGTVAALDIETTDGGYTSSLGGHFREVFAREGVLLRPLGNVIYLLPPYCVSDEQLTKGYDTIRKALSSLPEGTGTVSTDETAIP